MAVRHKAHNTEGGQIDNSQLNSLTDNSKKAQSFLILVLLGLLKITEAFLEANL